MYAFFRAATNKDSEDETNKRFIFNNIFRAFFRRIFVVNLWDIDRRIADNTEQCIYIRLIAFDCSNENQIQIEVIGVRP